jgi:hypothetical protein
MLSRGRAGEAEAIMSPSLALRVNSSDVMKRGRGICVVKKNCSEKEERKKGRKEKIMKE